MAKTSPFESSMTDLMISLVLIFMLMLASVMLKIKNNNDAETAKSGQTRQELITELTDILSARNIVVTEDKNDPLALVIVVGENANTLKFEQGQFSLDERDKQFLKQLIPNIMNVLYKETFRNSIDTIRIEGYTNDDGNDWNNLELSQKRALSVLTYSLSSEIKMSNNIEENKLIKQFIIDKASINGRGEIDKYLIKDSAGKVNKQLSRRVEIKIKIKSQEERRLQKERLESLDNAKL